jgi:hypothetical protein
MSEQVDIWRGMKDELKAKRATNREKSAAQLSKNGIPYTSHNSGAHLIVVAGDKTIDFWPGRGLWIVRGDPKRHGGVFNLIDYCKERTK